MGDCVCGDGCWGLNRIVCVGVLGSPEWEIVCVGGWVLGCR